MSKVAPRDIAPVLRKVRDFLLGRTLVHNHRWEAEMADRTQPQPELPDGPSHKHSANYYYTRDARRGVNPPIDCTKAALASGENKEGAGIGNRLPTPGASYPWDHHHQY
ncbi:NADH dehydrogenase [ubiquinone] 1 alpha subcomplex subunit 7 [Culicoides brevitarsis]|uniref:NADH dehydrogenase [ubiquinone] 1 alpha subcomplex subunit 7 n=1 Tax=Culicoides brevitarsis TaxID=469753 RepID=UPI00307B6052